MLRVSFNAVAANVGLTPHKLIKLDTFVRKCGLDFLEELVVEQANNRILIESHGGLIGLTLQHLLPERFKKTIFRQCVYNNSYRY